MRAGPRAGPRRQPRAGAALTGGPVLAVGSGGLPGQGGPPRGGQPAVAGRRDMKTGETKGT